MMSGVAIKVIHEDREVRQLFRGIVGHLGNMKPGMEIVGQIVRGSVIKNFEVEGRPRWQKSLRAIRTGGITLTRTRRLAKSVNYKATSVAVEIGSNVIYARIHQLGGEINPPARDRILHFRRNTVDLFANQDLANRHVHMPNGRTLHFRRNAGAGFSKPRKAHFGMKVAGKAYVIHMPQRQFLMIQDEDWAEIRTALEAFILTGGTNQ